VSKFAAGVAAVAIWRTEIRLVDSIYLSVGPWGTLIYGLCFIGSRSTSQYDQETRQRIEKGRLVREGVIGEGGCEKIITAFVLA
jgi:hypothetical protein